MDSKNIKTISQINVPSHAGYLRCAGACNNLTFQGGLKKKKPTRKLLLQKDLECGECVCTSDLKPTPEAALALAGLEGIYSGHYAKTLTAAGLIIYGLSVNHLRQDPKKYISKSSHLG